jgi:glucose/arabinose dehydrogenase
MPIDRPSSRSCVWFVALLLVLPMVRAQTAAPKVVPFATGLDRPWGMAFLPDGQLLVTERGGTMRRISADGQKVSAPITGLPPVRTGGQGGLLDVTIDPDFASTPWVYWSYSEAGDGGGGTAVARGKLAGDALAEVQVILRQQPKVGGGNHWGSRFVWAADKTLYVTLGDRQVDSPSRPDADGAQHLGKLLGKVVRIARDGSVPGDNPFVGRTGVRPEIYSFGHRNPQAAARHPTTGELWVVEHGPQGGDEVNRVKPGANYGWPLVSYGCPYGSTVGEACRVRGGTHAPRFEEPLTIWVPTSIAPSGMAFYTGERYPEWKGNLFIGALGGQALWRLTLEGDKVTAREALFADLRERIRDVRQGPDGWIYLLTDSSNGRILRLQR